MLFRKLFRLLVLGGAVVGTTSGSATPGQDQQAAEKKPAGGWAPDGGTAKAQGSEGGTTKAQGSDGGTAKAQGSDGGTTPDPGGGVNGW